MAKISVTSWNIRGLNSKFKRSLMFTYLKRYPPSILLLQETHLTGQKILALKKPWVGWHYHSTYSSYSRGVSILIRKGVPFEFIKLHTDYYGRFMILHGLLAHKPITIVNMYIPPPFAMSVLDQVVSKLAEFPISPFLIMGDFNNCMNPSLDRSKIEPNTSTRLAGWADALHLTEVWRWKNPTARVFSCHSLTHKSLSRIDLAFTSADLLPMVDTIQYLPQALSDHSPLSLSFRWNPSQVDRLWRLSPLWLKNDVVAAQNQNAYTEYWELNDKSASPPTLWDASKAVMRGELIAVISQVREEKKEHLNEAEKTLIAAEATHTQNPTEHTYEQLLSARSSLSRATVSLTRKAVLYQNQRIFEQGDKISKLLAYLSKPQNNSTAISHIRQDDGTLTTEPKTIAQQFASYYKNLYTTTVTYTKAQLIQYLASIPIPKLTPADRAYLDAPITRQEIADAIATLPPNKTPGPDGLPSNWYKALSENIPTKLLETLQYAYDNQALPASFAEALIVVIPKPGKDPSLCSSYRPISLINTDAKILAVRLQRVVPDRVHPDQSGFMPGRSTDINLRRLFTNLQIPHLETGTRAVASLDSAKAFDSIEWGYLWEVLSDFGFGQSFLKWIKLLHQRPTARVRVNGITSLPFSLERGTRQGCPLSPILFALAIEPLAILIRNTPGIKGLTYGNIKEKVSLYADDLLVYLVDPRDSLTSLLQLVDNFGHYSGLRINWDKSILCPVDPLQPQPVVPNIPLKWANQFKYLGVWITVDFTKYMSLNLDPLLSDLKTRLAQWSKLPLSLWGRINIIKMIYLPKFLYILHNAPVFILKTFFKTLNQIILPFVWNNRPPRMAWTKLCAPLTEGGLALPLFYHYYLASQIHYLHWCFIHDPYNPNMQLQATILGSLEGLSSFPYRHLKDTGPLPTTLTIPHKAWTIALTLLKHPPPLLTSRLPLWGNQYLPQLRSLHNYIYWPRHNIKYLGDLTEHSTFPTYAQI
ncbi:uncharacterized protein LOC105947410 [Xenopus tropicalis]|uniref:LINE-1 reverse transcriptase homolog n=1 Tax=Xenopus tropicalis TaxID=8364 RepID=A0A803K8D0_XENTR|nr:uncharacterized protein LOC105947410 [Xenopus tropicalis]